MGIYKRIHKTLFTVLCLAVFGAGLGGCGGSTSEISSSSGDVVTNANAAFADHDIVDAEDILCTEWEADPTNSELAFGCFLAKLLLLPDDSVATGLHAQTLLSTFDEPDFDINASLFDEPDGLFANPDLVEAGNSWPSFNYTDLNLPFADTFGSGLPLGTMFGGLLQNAIDNGVSTDDLQDQITAFSDDYEEFETLLQVVLDDTSFTYTLPAELFYTDSDIDVTYNDARLMMAANKGAIMGFNILSAYDFGIDIDDIVVSGEVDPEILLEDLNGSGATVNSVTVDSTLFLTLKSGGALTIASEETRFTDGIALLETALTALESGSETSELFGSTLDHFDLSRGVDFAQELTDSLSGMTSLDSLGTIKGRLISVDIGEFFSNPPDASTAGIISDPFVLESGTVKFVESYFASLLTDVAEF